MTSPSTRPTVLLAEDHADTRVLYAELLRGSSLDVIETGRGDQALELARSHRPALIVTDLSLPGISGIELARAVRADEATKGIPILCLSGYADPATSGEAKASGINRLLVKPCLPDDLLAHVMEFIEGN